MVVEDQIRELKKRFRLAMNGVVSTDMRRRGVEYGLNFGVALPTIRKMADALPYDLALADALWRENVRECRIVATLIVPADLFTCEELDEWVARPFTVELAEQLSHNLLVRLPFARSWACHAVGSPREEVCRSAFLALGKVSASEPLGSECRKSLLDSGVAAVQRSLSMLNPVLSAWERQLVGEPAWDRELRAVCAERGVEDCLAAYLADCCASTRG